MAGTLAGVADARQVHPFVHLPVENLLGSRLTGEEPNSMNKEPVIQCAESPKPTNSSPHCAEHLVTL
jgi:hypothetical protein